LTIDRAEKSYSVHVLRPYQAEAGAAIFDSIQNHLGRTITIEIARQGGKNELSAVLEMTLLTTRIQSGGTLIKASPTFKPQTIISIDRLKRKLDDFGFAGNWKSEMGYIISLGAARAVFLSADDNSNVVGHTADILLEIDEAQDVDQQKYSKEFRPMGAATNCTTVLYGTTWDDTTLLEQTKQANLELERYDGIRRHFAYDWQIVANCNKDYLAFALSERDRLGENHPLFRTQYALQTITSGGRLLAPGQLAQVLGRHSREHHPPTAAGTYIAAIDVAGEEPTDTINPQPSRDATVISIARLTTHNNQPHLDVVDLYSWTGRKHHELYPQMIDILKNVWRCRRIVVDATGIGEPIASFLEKSLGSRVRPFKFTQQSKSELGFNLLAAINSGRLKMFQGDGSTDYQQAMDQLEKARAHYRANQTMNFYVDPTDGHDDTLMSIALAVEATRDYTPKQAKGGIRHG